MKFEFHNDYIVATYNSVTVKLNKQYTPNAYVRLVYHCRIMPDGVVTPFLPLCKRCGKVIIVRKARTQHGVTTTVRSAESYKDTRFDELD